MAWYIENLSGVVLLYMQNFRKFTRVYISGSKRRANFHIFRKIIFVQV